jgi:hypothetical protein
MQFKIDSIGLLGDVCEVSLTTTPNGKQTKGLW